MHSCRIPSRWPKSIFPQSRSKSSKIDSARVHQASCSVTKHYQRFPRVSRFTRNRAPRIPRDRASVMTSTGVAVCRGVVYPRLGVLERSRFCVPLGAFVRTAECVGARGGRGATLGGGDIVLLCDPEAAGRAALCSAAGRVAGSAKITAGRRRVDCNPCAAPSGARSPSLV